MKVKYNILKQCRCLEGHMHSELKLWPGGAVEEFIYWWSFYLHRWFIVTSVPLLGCLLVCDFLYLLLPRGRDLLISVTLGTFLKPNFFHLLTPLPYTATFAMHLWALRERTVDFGDPVTSAVAPPPGLNFQIFKAHLICSSGNQMYYICICLKSSPKLFIPLANFDFKLFIQPASLLLYFHPKMTQASPKR